jgi:hypothetical protein
MHTQNVYGCNGDGYELTLVQVVRPISEEVASVITRARFWHCEQRKR